MLNEGITPIELEEVGPNEDEHIRVLKHEGRTLGLEEKFMHWKACSSTRINFINKIGSGSSKQIIDANVYMANV